jgi:hypothetical protein
MMVLSEGKIGALAFFLPIIPFFHYSIGELTATFISLNEIKP